MLAYRFGPGDAVRRALLRPPLHADTQQDGPHELGMPQHLQRSVQGRKDGFGQRAGSGVPQAAEGATTRAVHGQVQQRQNFGQHEHAHANHENEKSLLCAAQMNERVG